MIGSIKNILVCLITVGVLIGPVESLAKSQCEKHNSVMFKIGLTESGRSFLLKLSNEYSVIRYQLENSYRFLNRMLKKIDENTADFGNTLIAKRKIILSKLKQNKICIKEVNWALQVTRLPKSYNEFQDASKVTSKFYGERK